MCTPIKGYKLAYTVAQWVDNRRRFVSPNIKFCQFKLCQLNYNKYNYKYKLHQTSQIF